MKLILIAGALALFLSLFGTPALIKALARRGYGQIIRDDGPSTHHTKRGTPTMGGLIIIFASLVAYLVAHAVTQSAISTSAVLILGLVISLGFVGFLDDYMKISRQNSRGISGKQKILGQVLFASIFGYLGTRFPDKDGLTPISLNLSTVRDTSITLGVVLVVVWIALMVTATSNGVNLTDGLDGLATGASVMTFLAFVLIGVWEFGQSICWCMYGLPLVERISCKDFYGRYRLTCSRRSACRASCVTSRSAFAYSTGRTLRHHYSFGCTTSALLPNYWWKTPL
jgi:phospho-N-acetylmuramoyl-pentapeptide-transferase